MYKTVAAMAPESGKQRPQTDAIPDETKRSDAVTNAVTTRYSLWPLTSNNNCCGLGRRLHHHEQNKDGKGHQF
jgi:hypothetical protein